MLKVLYFEPIINKDTLSQTKTNATRGQTGIAQFVVTEIVDEPVNI
jgi:hypothetical protein